MLNLGSLDFTPDWARKDAGVKVPVQSKAVPQREERQRNFDRKPKFDRAPRPPRPVEKPLQVEVKILPETRALGTIIRKIQGDTHAYKLKDLAYFFLDNPASVLLKITPKEGESVKFWQCKACGTVSTNEADILEHLVSEHLKDYYVCETIECEAPKGNFAVVAKCGLSGVLLGPPNIHEFNSTVKEIIRTRYPDMSEEEYRSHIEMVRDAETIEEWRKSATQKTVYFAKTDAEKTRPLTREQAEGEFKRVAMGNMIESPKHLMITADKALKSPVKPLVWAVKDAFREEGKAPYNMCFALRGAFHHRKLKFFRANDPRGPEFVTAMELKEFDSAHAIPELSAVADFVKAHPCSPKVDIVKDAEGERHLNWLVTTGHLVAYTNGVYSAVEKFPKYGPQYQKRGKQDETAAKLAE